MCNPNPVLCDTHWEKQTKLEIFPVYWQARGLDSSSTGFGLLAQLKKNQQNHEKQLLWSKGAKELIDLWL